MVFAINYLLIFNADKIIKQALASKQECMQANKKKWMQSIKQARMHASKQECMQSSKQGNKQTLASKQTNKNKQTWNYIVIKSYFYYIVSRRI